MSASATHGDHNQHDYSMSCEPCYVENENNVIKCRAPLEWVEAA